MPPYAAKTPCCYPGCMKTVNGRYCDDHEKSERKKADKLRGTPAQRGYDARWRKIRLQVLTNEPLCRFCMERGIYNQANVVDHVDGNSRNNDRVNLRPCCKRCHDQRTARDQGWGRKNGDN